MPKAILGRKIGMTQWWNKDKQAEAVTLVDCSGCFVSGKRTKEKDGYEASVLGIKEKKGKMVVVNKDEMVYEVLKLAGLHNVWVIVESREEGYSKLGVSGSRSVSSGEGGSSGKALIITGTVALIAAIVGLVMVKQGGGFLGSAKTAQMLNVACSLISLITGMMLLVPRSRSD